MRKTREYIKSRFIRGARPTQQDFHDLFDSTFFHLDDDFDINALSEYNPLRTYNKGDTFIYNGTLYLCLFDGVSGEFDISKHEQIGIPSKLYQFPRWNENTNYSINTIIRWKHKLWLSLIDNNIGNEPNDISTAWMLLFFSNYQIVAWQPGVFFKEQIIIDPFKNQWRIKSSNYLLSQNLPDEIQQNKWERLGINKKTFPLKFSERGDIINYSNGFKIEIGGNITDYFNEYDECILSNSIDHLLTVFDSSYDENENKTIIRIKESFYPFDTGEIYYNKTSRNIIEINANPSDNWIKVDGIIEPRPKMYIYKNNTSEKLVFNIIGLNYENGQTTIMLQEDLSNIQINDVANFFLNNTTANGIYRNESIIKTNLIDYNYQPDQYAMVNRYVYPIAGYTILDGTNFNLLYLQTGSELFNFLYEIVVPIYSNIQHNFYTSNIIADVLEEISKKSQASLLGSSNYQISDTNIIINNNVPISYSLGNFTLILIG